ncbi:MAG: ATP-binding protein [Ignavibacteria bacterium]|nr:ATP-binding protein [Ignavibacteria bacterium]
MKIFKILNSKIRYKLTVGFVLISLFVGVVGYLGLSTILHIEKDYNLVSTSQPLVQSLENMKFACLRLISSASEYAYIQAESKNTTPSAPIEHENDLMQQSCNQCHKAFSQYEHLVKKSFPELIENSNEIRDWGSRVHTIALEFIEMKKQKISGTEALEKKEEMEVSEMGFLGAVNHTLDRTNETLNKERAQLVSSISSSLINIIVFSGLTLLLSVLFGFLYSRSIANPITKLTQQTDSFRKGNLDTDIDIKSTDEIGVLGRSFNEMANRIKRLISQLEEEVNIVKLAEEELRESEGRYKNVSNQLESILDHIPGLVFYKDKKNNYVRVNKYVADAYGKTKVELENVNISELHTKEVAEKYYQDDLEVIKSGNAKLNIEEKWETATEQRWINTSKIPFVNNSGEIFGVVGISMDITERKKAEAEMEAEQEKQREILEKLNNLSGLLAEDTTLGQNLEKGLQIILSTHFLGLKQMGAIFLVNNKNKELVLECNINLAPALQTMCAFVPFGHCLCGRAALTGEIQYADCLDERHDNRYDGIKPHGHYNIPIISDEELLGVIVVYLSEGHPYNSLEVSFLRSTADVFSAIIKRKQAETEIKLKNEQLQRTNSEKDKFFSIIAHDLKSPFQGFLNMTELMADKTEKFSLAEFAENSKALNESARILYKLLDNLLEWAQMQRGAISFTPKELNLSTFALQNIEIINQRAVQKGITISNEIPGSLKVNADERMINTVLRNLLSNAVKFTNRGGKIIVRCKKIENAMIEVSVQDTGVGMAEKNVKRLFKMEEKVSSKGTEDEPSTGLGLLLCKEFVKKNGGNIWVESEEEKGSIFYFTVPEINRKNT